MVGALVSISEVITAYKRAVGELPEEEAQSSSAASEANESISATASDATAIAAVVSDSECPICFEVCVVQG